VIKRVILSLVVAVALLAGMTAAEVVLALKREYLPTEPRLKVEGLFGSEGGVPLRLVVLGDSTAAGVGAGSAAGTYPEDLARRFGSDGFRVHLTGLGISGARVADVLKEQIPLVQKLQPDLVFVGIGANDVTHLTSLTSVRTGMQTIIRRLKATGAAVVVAGAPDMRAAAWLEPLRSLAGWRGRQVTAAVAAAARSEHVTVVPLAEKTGPVFAREPDRYNSADRFHPSADGYEVWAGAIYPYLKKALPARPGKP
jgi:lysophospholipase L1-like esterase